MFLQKREVGTNCNTFMKEYNKMEDIILKGKIEEMFPGGTEKDRWYEIS